MKRFHRHIFIALGAILTLPTIHEVRALGYKDVLAGAVFVKESALDLYSVFEAQSELGTHGFQIQLSNYENRRTWKYAGKNKWSFRSAAIMADGTMGYTTSTDSGSSREPFQVGSGLAGGSPLEVRDYSCPATGPQAFGNSDGTETLAANFKFVVTHKYENLPTRYNRRAFELNGIYSRMQAPAVTRSALGRIYESTTFVASTDFVISPGGRALVEFKLPKNFEIESPAAIFVRLGPVFLE